MVQITWAKRAITDLDFIGKYIGRDSENEAQKFVQELIKKAGSLIRYPEKGRPIPEKISGNYRQILYKNYRIIYKVDRKKIIVSSVYHQKKLLFKLD